MRLVVTAVTLVLVTGCGSSGGAHATPAPVAGAFSAAQAQRGASVYNRSCGDCHELADFRGTEFATKWRRSTAWDLYRVISETMPEDNPGNLSDAAYADVVAYVLSLNGFTAGAHDLPPTRDRLMAIPLGPEAARSP